MLPQRGLSVCLCVRTPWVKSKTPNSCSYLQHIRHAMLSDGNVSQGSIATPLTCGGSVMKFLLQISCECNSERIINCENRSIFGEVMDKSLLSCFLWLTVYVCMCVTLVDPAKALDGMRCHLTGTLVTSNFVLDREGEILGRNPQFAAMPPSAKLLLLLLLLLLFLCYSTCWCSSFSWPTYDVCCYNVVAAQ